MRHYTEAEILQNLKDAGCENAFIEEFMHCISSGECEKERKLLEKHRKCLLEQVHKGEQEISCLDYLLYQLRKDEE